MDNVHVQYYHSFLGELIIGSYNNKICICDWKQRITRNQVDGRILKKLNAQYIEKSSQTIDMTISQLDEYFSGTRVEFNLPLLMIGTPFQKKVWSQLLHISYGKTITYLQLAKKLGNEKSIRAAAAANGANPISIIVPCHRIIGNNGKLVGYAGGLIAKKELLKLEIKSSQLELFN